MDATAFPFFNRKNRRILSANLISCWLRLPSFVRLKQIFNQARIIQHGLHDAVHWFINFIIAFHENKLNSNSESLIQSISFYSGMYLYKIDKVEITFGSLYSLIMKGLFGSFDFDLGGTGFYKEKGCPYWCWVSNIKNTLKSFRHIRP